MSVLEDVAAPAPPRSGRVTEWLERAPPALFCAFAGLAALSAYSAMYAFRKPIAAASFDHVAGWSFAVDYKSALIIAQTLGYALSKIVNEKTARAFAVREGADIYALRIGNVIIPEDYTENFPKWFADPGFRKRIAWSYIDARDLGQIARLAIEKDGLGFQVFNAVNDDTSSNLPTAQLLKRFYPNVPVKRKLGEFESLLCNKKIREVLGFKEEHNWRKYVRG